MIDFTFDEDTGIVRVTGTGTWSLAEVDAYFERMEALLISLRAQGRPVRILTDVTCADLQSPEIDARINEHSVRLRRPGHRVAIITRTNLLKAHIRAAAQVPGIEMFCSHAAAEIWLTAHDRRLRA